MWSIGNRTLIMSYYSPAVVEYRPTSQLLHTTLSSPRVLRLAHTGIIHLRWSFNVGQVYLAFICRTPRFALVVELREWDCVCNLLLTLKRCKWTKPTPPSMSNEFAVWLSIPQILVPVLISEDSLWFT